MKVLLLSVFLISASVNFSSVKAFESPEIIAPQVSSIDDILQQIKEANPGDTIIINNGRYHNFNLNFEANGLEGKEITIKAETSGNVIFTGQSNIKFKGSYIVLDGFVFTDGYYKIENSTDSAIMLGDANSHHNRITNITIDGYNPPSKEIDVRWVRVYGKHNRVDNSTFINKNSQGLMLEIVRPKESTEPNYAQIDHNYFAFFEKGVGNGAETLRIGTSEQSQTDSNSVVEYNVFEECNGEIEFISNKSGGNIYRYNTILNTEGNLTLRHGNSCTVESNVFLNTKGLTSAGGVRVMDSNHIV
jgi:poly(beta-D-mannuronate) lyase